MNIDWWRAFPFAVCLLFWLFVLMVMVGCACPAQSYQPVPTWLVPVQPTVPIIMAADLMCISDEVYTRLAERDRTCWQYARELRALLGDN